MLLTSFLHCEHFNHKTMCLAYKNKSISGAEFLNWMNGAIIMPWDLDLASINLFFTVL